MQRKIQILAVALLAFTMARLRADQADGMTALHAAVIKDDVAQAQQLLAAGADPRAKTRVGDLTPLLVAAERGTAGMVGLLLKNGADVNAPDATGATPLMLAAASGSATTVDLLLANGATINAKESARGQTALMFAAAADRADVIRVLMQHGADAEIASMTSDPACGSLFGNSNCGGGRNKNNGKQLAALETTETDAAVATKDVEKGSKRRRAGVTVIGGMTALLYAARDGQANAVQALVESGAKIDNPGVGEKMTPLIIAIANGHYDLAMYLLQKGADPNAVSSQGLTALYATLDMEWAPYAYRPQPIAGRGEVSHLDLLQALLNHGASPNAKLTQKVWFRSLPQDRSWVDPTGATAFWRAAQSTDIEAMRMLLRAGADPKLASDEGVTPLMVASGLGWAPNFSRNAPDAWMDSVKLCLELGLEVNAKSDKTYTPLHGAAFLGDKALIEFLVARGADVRAVATDGNTVADMANGPIERSIPRPDIVALLEGLGSQNSHNCRSDSCVVAATSKRRP